jgi:hypothetical protein
MISKAKIELFAYDLIFGEDADSPTALHPLARVVGNLNHLSYLHACAVMRRISDIYDSPEAFDDYLVAKPWKAAAVEYKKEIEEAIAAAHA